MVAVTELVGELKTLRKGRGIFISQIGDRIGSALRDVCQVTDDDGPAIIRQKVANKLQVLAGDLPPDLRVAVMAAFALCPDVRMPLYRDRVGWAAARLNRDPRTARRRIDDGGTLLDRAMESSERFAFTLALPRPLARGETHDYALQLSFAGRQPARPYFVCVPKQPCDVFDLRVRFDRTEPPARIRRLSDAFQRDVDDPVSGGDPLSADPAGEIHLTFRGLTPGLAYGARWD